MKTQLNPSATASAVAFFSLFIINDPPSKSGFEVSISAPFLNNKHSRNLQHECINGNPPSSLRSTFYRSIRQVHLIFNSKHHLLETKSTLNMAVLFKNIIVVGGSYVGKVLSLFPKPIPQLRSQYEKLALTCCRKPPRTSPKSLLRHTEYVQIS